MCKLIYETFLLRYFQMELQFRPYFHFRRMDSREPKLSVELIQGHFSFSQSYKLTYVHTGGPPLVRSPLVRFPLVRILLP